MLTDNDLEKIGTLVGAIIDNRLEARLGGFEARFSGIEARLDAIEVRLTSLENRITSIEKRLDSLENEFFSFRADMSALYLSHDQRISILEAVQVN